MKENYKIVNLEDFDKSIERLLKEKSIEEASLGIYYIYNGGLIIPNNTSAPTSALIFGNSHEQIAKNCDLLGSLEKCQ